MKIIVIGGTGLIGSKVVKRLEARGHDVVAASPQSGVNTVTGEGLDAVLAGASVVVDVSNSPSWKKEDVVAFFEASTKNLLAAEAKAGVKHHVALSVVGTHRLAEAGADYFFGKVAQEKLITSGSMPYTIVHATQFFEFVKGIADGSMVDGKVHLPSALIQPIASDDVADAVTDAALAAPTNGIVEVGGPDAMPMDQLIRDALERWNDPREVVTDDSARYFGAKLSERMLVPAAGARLGKLRFT